MKKLLAVFFIFLSAQAFALEAESYAKFTQVQTIASDFKMEKHLSIAKQPLASTGKFYFERPGFLRWEYLKPFPSGILLNGEKAYSWRTGKNGKDVKDISSQPFAKILAQQIYVFVSMDLNVLGERYTVTEFEGGLKLEPKDISPKQSIKEINLYMNKEKDALTRVDMVEKGGDKTVIYFTNTVLNTPIAEEIYIP
ncbi:outer membrane lipoprotein-sorting protein [Elusimicrobium posterum]|uniref:LolA family protein n=1 Tax=Elusimicrobium posterum TaxID=3116653 RepID=UPI003C724C4C